MCLLSFVNLGTRYTFTSNRDISKYRPSPHKIAEHRVNGKAVFFPMDYKGGSWFVYDTDSLMILLNGARRAHLPKEEYRLSRGLILIDLFTHNRGIGYWESIDLIDIEPFTIVFFTAEGSLKELIWDGTRKSINTVDCSKNRLWLSSTLYTDHEKMKSIDRFNSTSILTDEDVLKFNKHNIYSRIKEPETRKEQIKTTCIYQLSVDRNGTTCKELLL